jgi:hypothetical protein
MNWLHARGGDLRGPSTLQHLLETLLRPRGQFHSPVGFLNFGLDHRNGGDAFA